MKKVFLCFLSVLFSSVTAFSLEPDSAKTVALQELEVISVRADEQTPMAYSNMNKQDIESRNFGQDIPFLITQTPSVIVTSDAGTGIGYTGFRIRGTDAKRINITTNGIPLNDSESHAVFWVNMPDFASSLQDLQIQRGVGTSTNGAGAFGASINMKTENIPMQAYCELDAGYGSFNTSKATFKLGSGNIGRHFAFDGRISSIASDGFIDRASADLKSYFAQGSYFTEKTLVKLVTFGGKERTYHAWDGVPAEILSDIFLQNNRSYNPSGYMGDDANGNPLYYKNQTDNYLQTHYQLSLLQRLADNFTLNAALHYTKGAGYYEEYKTKRSLIEYGLSDVQITESDLVRQKHLDNDFYGGVFSLDYKRKKWNVSLGGGANRYDGNHFGKVIWTKIEDYIDHEYYRSTGDKTDANIYLKGNYIFLEGLNVYSDLQYRFIDYQIKGKNSTFDARINEMQNLDVKKRFNFFNPKAGVFYQINTYNNVYGSVAVAHREPNRDNYTENISEKPRMERLIDYEVGYKFGNRTFAAGVNLYYMRYKDQLVLNGKTNEIGEPLTSNVPVSYRAGVELTAGVKINPDLHWDGNITLSDNRIKNYTEYTVVYSGDDWDEEAEQHRDYYKKTPIAYSPNVIANSILSYQYKSFGANLQSSYVGRQFLDNTGNKERSLDAYFVNNLRLGYDFSFSGINKLSVNVLINNIFDEQYENNGFAGYYYYRNSDGTLDTYNWSSYFPQAGTNMMVNIVLKF
ncbi:MAG: TonB-dependent receptor [Candidatus Symbiothrix sp.]|jgi:iron complex outermembrane receptor protein|nr:TonB-dependent receptor [Candidatus Symbiothrix sp.]